MCEQPSELIPEIALDVFARLIEILAERGVLTAAEVMELAMIAGQYGRGH